MPNLLELITGAFTIVAYTVAFVLWGIMLFVIVSGASIL